MSTGCAALATTHRVIDGVHGHRTGAGTTTLPTCATGFAALLQHVLGIAHRTYRGEACAQYHAHFTAWHFQRCVLAISGVELREGSSTAHEAAALAGLQFNVVHDGTQRDLAKGQRVANLRRNTGACLLYTSVPHSKQLAVELRVDGNDVTFVRIGSHVRLQFEGWPAVQFVGWPSAAVGTFGGKVAFIDRFDQGDGSFRVMVLPDPRPFEEPEWSWSGWLRRRLTHDSVASAENPHAWPDESWLRQGVHAKGWILLDEVSIGYEIWRNLNGFPPSLQTPPSDPAVYGDGSGSKAKSKSKSGGEEKGK